MEQQLRYPIGPFEPIAALDSEERERFIAHIPEIVRTLRAITQPLTLDQLQTPYRPGGWTLQQVVHHMADNDMNAYLRFKRGLTEDEPEASSYLQDDWAALHDYASVPVDTSLALLEALHARFHTLLRGLQPNEFKRTLRTQALGRLTLDTALQRFVWHDRHHIAQIQSLVERMGW